MRERGGPTRRDFVRQAPALVLLTANGPRALRSISAASAPVRGSADGEALALENDAIRAEWSSDGEGLRLRRIEDRRSRRALASGRGAFTLALEGGLLLDSSEMRRIGPPRVEDLTGDPRASRASERLPGRRIALDLADPAGRLRVAWRAVLREGAHYVRQEIAVTAAEDAPIREIGLVDLDAPGATVAGTVAGSPLTAGTWFFAFEHPLADSTAGRRARSALSRALPLRAGQTARYASVVGAAREGQLRRDFLAYVERERARPYRPFLHYNSWYDLGYFTPFDEAAALAVIEAFGRELREKRGVALDSFLFDDGWDDHRLWGFHAGFPRGFAAARRGRRPPGVRARRLALAVGRLREAAAGAPRVREGAGLRDERERPRALGAGLLPAIS